MPCFDVLKRIIWMDHPVCCSQRSVLLVVQPSRARFKTEHHLSHRIRRRPSVRQLIAALIGIVLVGQAHATVLDIDPATVEAASWIIVDPQTHQTIAGYQVDQQRSPASLTKMMVAYLTLQAVQHGKLSANQLITAGSTIDSVQSDESQMHLKAGERVPLADLLGGLVIMSANDAALTLAERIGGSTEQFVAQMNQTAQSLHMRQTHFANPSGITMAGHYSTAADLALLSEAIVRQTPEYLNYSRQQSFRYGTFAHEATNLLLKRDPSVDGLKTGYTTDAGYNLALTASRPDPVTGQMRRLIVVVMGTASKQKRAEVAHQLLNIAYRYTQNFSPITQPRPLVRFPVKDSTDRNWMMQLTPMQSVATVSVLPPHVRIDARSFDVQRNALVIGQQVIAPLGQPTGLHYQVTPLQTELQAPLLDEQPLASIQISQYGQPLLQRTLSANPNINSAPFITRVWLTLLNQFRLWFGPTPQPQVYQLPDQ